jgi:hypothetical protein
MGDGQRSTVGRKIATSAAVLVALVAIAGVGLAYIASHPARGVFCTVAGSIGAPVADSPEAAFEAWWEQTHPDGPSIEDADIDRDGNDWHIDKGTEDWVKVSVGKPFPTGDGPRPEGFAVNGANRCGYADAG